MNIPMADLKLQHQQIKGEVNEALQEVLDNTSFIMGPAVVRFEEDFAEYNGVEYCAGVSNGTDALKLALLACDIGPGDEVITTAHTFGATVEAICDVGAKPVFVDIEEQYFTMDVTQIEGVLTKKN